jgi:hypothetical protein
MFRISLEVVDGHTPMRLVEEFLLWQAIFRKDEIQLPRPCRWGSIQVLFYTRHNLVFKPSPLPNSSPLRANLFRPQRGCSSADLFEVMLAYNLDRSGLPAGRPQSADFRQ